MAFLIFFQSRRVCFHRNRLGFFQYPQLLRAFVAPAQMLVHEGVALFAGQIFRIQREQIPDHITG